MKGFWFYGMAGAGKTTAAEYLASLQHNAFLIDGDVVRRYISTDLGYTEADREIQIGRIFGICLLAMDNQMMPIASTVFMNEQTLSAATKAGITVVEICRNHDDLAQVRTLYDGTHDNVVGVSVSLPSLATPKIKNKRLDEFFEAIGQLLSAK
jgi:adenylylsulfate kinase-like enzyme